MATALILLILLIAFSVLVLALARAVRSDGYGTRPAPSSHHDWDEGWTPAR